MAKTSTVKTIKGRNRFADEAVTTITICDAYDKEMLVIEGGYIEKRARAGRFVIAAKHPTATDEEGDSSYVAMIEGAGLVWVDMMTDTHEFTGALLSAQYIDEDDARNFIDLNGYLNFTPPERKWVPGAYTIKVRHHTPKEGS